MPKKRNKFHQGIFEPINKQKYLGKKKYSYFRSSWELAFMKRLDESKKVVKWGSECIVVPYTFNGKTHRYYTDFYMEMVSGKKYLIEIKPYKQTLPPRKTKNKSKKTLLHETVTYHKNVAKWEAAIKYCEKRGWEFVIKTEKNLTI